MISKGLLLHWLQQFQENHAVNVLYTAICCIYIPFYTLLPGKSHGWRSLVGCSPWGRWGSDTTERLHFHFSLSCIGEGNGNLLQCSCLENPRDGGAWWAAVYWVAQTRTRLKWLRSSSSSKHPFTPSWWAQKELWNLYPAHVLASLLAKQQQRLA